MAGGLPVWVVVVSAVVGGVALLGAVVALCCGLCRRARVGVAAGAGAPEERAAVGPAPAVVDLLLETRAVVAALPWDHMEACRPAGVWCATPPPPFGPPQALLWRGGGTVAHTRATLSRAVLRAVARAIAVAPAGQVSDLVLEVRLSLVSWPSRGCVVLVVDVGPPGALPPMPPHFTWLPWTALRWPHVPHPVADAGPLADATTTPLVVTGRRGWARAMVVFRHEGASPDAVAPTVTVPWTAGDAGAGTLARGRAVRAQGHAGPLVVSHAPLDVRRRALAAAGFDGVVFTGGPSAS